ncbi:hypothetical protein KY284_021498 [Solanum tuberosum]|nr:hypothetical protein KY284_021497 [Solanum tuberosum]KAH0680413.1 hypothetical protein KY284_021498 [Solanum tuberosum]
MHPHFHQIWPSYAGVNHNTTQQQPPNQTNSSKKSASSELHYRQNNPSSHSRSARKTITPLIY